MLGCLSNQVNEPWTRTVDQTINLPVYLQADSSVCEQDTDFFAKEKTAKSALVVDAD
jgi:hypothetical protein